MTVKDELLTLQAKDPDSILRVEAIHVWAKSHPRSALYAEIEWNTAKAAQEYQFWQIRRLIQLNITSEDGEPQIVSLVMDRSKPGGGYRSISDVLSSKALSMAMLNDALQELERVRVKYQRVKELTAVWEAVGKVRKRTVPRDSKGTRVSA